MFINYFVWLQSSLEVKDKVSLTSGSHMAWNRDSPCGIKNSEKVSFQGDRRKLRRCCEHPPGLEISATIWFASLIVFLPRLSLSGNSESNWRSLIINVQVPMQSDSPGLVLWFGFHFHLRLYYGPCLPLFTQHPFLWSISPTADSPYRTVNHSAQLHLPPSSPDWPKRPIHRATGMAM